jgi:kynurenine formamidase
MSSIENYTIPLSIQGEHFRAVCHRIHMDGMSGTYIDFPGHIAETDDGVDAADCPLDRLLMLEGTVIHLDRAGRGREVTAEELDAAGVAVKGDALVIHALGEKEFYDYSVETIPYYGPSAIEWILSKDVRLFASDIYENKAELQGIFSELFRRGVATVCCPVNLRQVSETYPRVSAIPARMEGAVQLPCRCFVVERV